MNYSELLTNVRNYTEVTADVLTNAVINVFITNTENQIDRLLDSDAQRRYATTTCILALFSLREPIIQRSSKKICAFCARPNWDFQ